jgi:chromosome segregation ATPase
MNYPLIVALIAALAAPLLGYLAAARRLSGKIQTSEASSLWQEASNLRSEYREELATVRRQLDECLLRIKNVETLNEKLKVENGGLNKTVKDQARQIEELQSAIAVLEGDKLRLSKEAEFLKAEAKTLRDRVLELEKHNGG